MRRPAYTNADSERVAWMKLYRSGPAMIPMPNSDVSYFCRRALRSSALPRRRPSNGAGATDRPPVPAPGVLP